MNLVAVHAIGSLRVIFYQFVQSAVLIQLVDVHKLHDIHVAQSSLETAYQLEN